MTRKRNKKWWDDTQPPDENSVPKKGKSNSPARNGNISSGNTPVVVAPKAASGSENAQPSKKGARRGRQYNTGGKKSGKTAIENRNKRAIVDGSVAITAGRKEETVYGDAPNRGLFQCREGSNTTPSSEVLEVPHDTEVASVAAVAAVASVAEVTEVTEVADVTKVADVPEVTEVCLADKQVKSQEQHRHGDDVLESAAEQNTAHNVDAAAKDQDESATSSDSSIRDDDNSTSGTDTTSVPSDDAAACSPPRRCARTSKGRPRCLEGQRWKANLGACSSSIQALAKEAEEAGRALRRPLSGGAQAAARCDGRNR